MKKYYSFDLISDKLKRSVTVSVYLPKNYENNNNSYPVLYMHDGQNLFDSDLAFAGKTWGVIEAFENDETLPELIVIGINSSKTRSDELVPFKFYSKSEKRDSGGKADEYYSFIIESVKPIIDQKYRTKICREFTGVMGSSYGGLSSTYAALKYNKYFSKFGCVSNAYFPVQKELESMIVDSKISENLKFYMDVGTKETEDELKNKIYVDSNQSVYELLCKKIDPEKIKFKIIKDAIHHETAWEIRFPEIIRFLFED